MKETIIYVRTSTEEQNPQNQLKDCQELTKRLGFEDYEVLPEKKSAFKDNIEREIFNSIREAITKGEVKNLIVWDLDRIYRHRIRLLDFLTFCNVYKVKVYSFRQEFLNVFDNLKLPQGFEFLTEMYRNNFLQFLGWIAEEESEKKSQRVKIAVRRGEGVTKSYKGNKWGRRSLQNTRLIEQILSLNSQGRTIRQIAEQVYYYDENRNKKLVSKSFVHKLLAQNRGTNLRNYECPKTEQLKDRRQNESDEK
ncbi:MAG: recombinase family protein [Candidatus Pacearchaeota archaeon]|jgi:DNA invertase Pin-like site-specific DNA recombinase